MKNEGIKKMGRQSMMKQKMNKKRKENLEIEEL